MLSGGAIVSNRGSFLVVLLLRFSGSLVPGLHCVSNEIPSRSFKIGIKKFRRFACRGVTVPINTGWKPMLLS